MHIRKLIILFGMGVMGGALLLSANLTSSQFGTPVSDTKAASMFGGSCKGSQIADCVSGKGCPAGGMQVAQESSEGIKKPTGKLAKCAGQSGGGSSCGGHPHNERFCSKT